MEINLKRQLTPFEWNQFSMEIKGMFKETFKIPRSAGTVVMGNEVLSDGHTVQDLSAVSLSSLQQYLETDDDHWDNLLKLTINKMERNVNGSTNNQPKPVTKHETTDRIVKRKPGRPSRREKA